MGVNDPWELTLGVEPPLEEVEEDIDPMDERRRVFHSQIRRRPDDTSYHNSFEVDICRFDERGRHVQAGKHCPHYNVSDEEGPRIRPNWTVQQDRR